MSTITLTETTFEATVTSPGLVLVDFWAAWCGPCRRFGPVFEQASQTHPDVIFAKVDTEAQARLAAALEIRSIPTLMAFRDGILLVNQAGALPAPTLEKMIQTLQALDMDTVRADVAAATPSAEAAR